MADIKIVVGLDKSLTYNEFASGLNSVIARINSNAPKKIKVGIDEKYLQTAINNAIKAVKVQGVNLTSSTAGSNRNTQSNASSGNYTTGQIHTITQQASNVKTQIDATIRMLQKEMSTLTTGSEQYDVIKQKIADLSAANETLVNALGDVKKASTNATDEMIRGLTEAQESASRVLSENLVSPKALDAQNKEIETIKSQFESLKNFKMPATATEELRTAFESLLQEAEKFYDVTGSDNRIKENFDANKAAIENAKAAIKSFTQETKNTNTWTGKLGEKLKSAATSLIGLVSAYRIYAEAKRIIREMVNAAIELDDAMTQLKIVTDDTAASYRVFMDRVSVSARELAVNIKDLITATTTYARLGYSIEESTTMAELTTMLQSVGDIDATSAQEAITSMVKAFGISIDDLEQVMDELVTVGNNFPISVSQLAQGMTNASSTLAAAGNSIEESIALLMAANVTIQDAAKSSTGIRTLTARLRNTTVDLEELGEDMTKSKYEELVQTLTDYNVRLTDINGEYRSTYAIMKDIAAQWHNLTSMEQAALATQIAGVRQQAVFYSIIGQFQEAENAMDAMSDSAGAMSHAYETYLDSVTAHINRFKAAFQTLSYETSNTNMLKSFIDAGTVLIDLVTKVVKLNNSFGGLKTTIMAVVSAIMLLNQAKVAKGITAIYEGLYLLPTAIGDIGRNFKALFTGIKSGITGAGGDFSKLAGSISSVASVAMMAGTVVMAIISYVKQKYEEMRQAALDQREAAADEAAQIQNSYLEYARLAQAYSEGAASSEELLNAENALMDTLGIEQSMIGELIAQYGDYTTAIEAATRAKLEEARVNQRAGLNQLRTDVMNLSERDFSIPISSGTRASRLLVQAGYARADSIEALLNQGWSMEAAMQSGSSSSILMDTTSVEGRVQAYRDLKDMMLLLTAAGESNSDTFARVAEVYNSIAPTIEALVDGEREWNETLLAEYQVGRALPQSYTAFTEYRANFIRQLQEDQNYVGSQALIEDVVDSYLRQQEGFAVFYSEFAASSRSARDQVVADIHDLIDSNEKLKHALEELGLSAEDLADMSPKEFITTMMQLADTLGLTEDQIDAIQALGIEIDGLRTDGVENLVEEFGVLADSIASATDAQTELQEALTGYKYDDLYRNNVQYLEALDNLINEEGYGLGYQPVQAYMEALGITADSSEELRGIIENISRYLMDGSEGIENFLNDVQRLNQEGLLDESIAFWDGEEFYYDINMMEEFAEAMGLDEDILLSITEAFHAYTDEVGRGITAQEHYNEFLNEGIILASETNGVVFADEIARQTGMASDAVEQLIGEINKLRQENGQEPLRIVGEDQITITQDWIDELEAAGTSAEEIIETMSNLMEYENVSIEAGVQLTVDDEQVDLEKAIAATKARLSGDTSDIVAVEIEMSVNGEEVIAEVTTTAERIQNILGTEDWEILINSDDAETRITSINTLLSDLPDDTPVTVTDYTNDAIKHLTTLNSLLVNVRNNANISIPSVGQTTTKGRPYASGTRNAARGMALLGDEYSPSGAPRPELVVSDGYAYIAGQHGPEFAELNAGDVVYTAEETRKILRNGGNNAIFPAHSGGKKWVGGVKNRSSSLVGSRSAGSSSSSSSSYSSSSSSTPSIAEAAKEEVKEAENWFERAYKDHKHLIEMDQEEMADYLQWLNWAYKKAYDENLIDLDEFYKYQEEIYKGLQSLFMDYLDDVEHEISMRENFEAEGKNIVKIYQKALKEVEKEIKAARAAGLDDTDDYIQKLQDKWWSYYDEITEIREKAAEEAKDAVDELVDIRIKMLKQQISNEKDAIKERLSNLKDFYQKQKDLLRDAYDEDKYLEEQTEKRKAVSDLQAELNQLEYDDSAWAQKKRLELAEELADAQKDLSDFEKEHALENAQDELDKMLEIQEKKLDAQTAALEAQEQNAKQLYDQALADIKNGSVKLYKEMIQWNNTYGDGIQATITDKWEAAYKALKDYSDLYGKSYNGINLANATGYKADNSTWSSSSISGSSASAKGTTATIKGTTSKPSSSTPKTATASTSVSAAVQSPPPATAVPNVGQTVQVKQGTQWWSGRSGGVHMASWVPGSSFTVMQVAGDEVLIGRGGQVTGWILKSNLVGYAKGTSSATPGLHRVDEIGAEAIFTSSDGSKYRLFSGGEKVLSAKATDFLYNFANNGEAILSKIIKSAFGEGMFSSMQPAIATNNISMGDIIVQGNADKETVSAIRRAQRDTLDSMLRELNRLNK